MISRPAQRFFTASHASAEYVREHEANQGQETAYESAQLGTAEGQYFSAKHVHPNDET